MKIITDLERIADQSADISELIIRPSKKPINLNHDIYTMAMAEKSRNMVGRSIDAFIKHDIDTAKAVCADDDEVDDLFNIIGNGYCQQD